MRKQAEDTAFICFFHGEFVVEYDAEILRVVSEGGWGSKIRRPPGVVPQGGSVAKDQHFRLSVLSFRQLFLIQSATLVMHLCKLALVVVVVSSESERDCTGLGSCILGLRMLLPLFSAW